GHRKERLRRKKSARIAEPERAGPPQNARGQEAKHLSGKAEAGLRIELYRHRRDRLRVVGRDRVALRLRAKLPAPEPENVLGHVAKAHARRRPNLYRDLRMALQALAGRLLSA